MINPETQVAKQERKVLPSDISSDELLGYMIEADMPLLLYGKDGAKTINHLIDELREGESILSMDENGKLYREVGVLWLNVLCKMPNGAVYALREDRQVHRDGTVKRRQLLSSLGEKLKAQEDSRDVVPRALAEELQVGEEYINELYFQGEDHDILIPDTYPGLETQYKFFKYTAVIDEAAFRSEGYIEEQQDKTNYYLWDQIH